MSPIEVWDNLNVALDRLLSGLKTSVVLRKVAEMNLEDLKQKTPVSTRYRWGLGTSREELPGTQRESWTIIKKGASYFVTPNTPYSKKVLFILNLGSSGSKGERVPTTTGRPWRFIWVNLDGEWHVFRRRRIPPVYQHVGFVNDAIEQTLKKLPELLRQHIHAILEVAMKGGRLKYKF